MRACEWQRQRHVKEISDSCGDAVLGLVTSHELFQRFPKFQEGQLSKMRAHLVSARHLVKVARNVQLGRFLLLGRGEERLKPVVIGGRDRVARAGARRL